MNIQRLNHAVLYVSDLKRSVAFYQDVLGFEVISREGPMAFLRAKGSDNHHDLGLLERGTQALKPPRGSIGLYHLAWQLQSIQELAEARETLLRAGALTGESDHGATKSIYAADPDGNEFEVMVLIPRKDWGRYEHEAPIKPLNWAKELENSSPAERGRGRGEGTTS